MAFHVYFLTLVSCDGRCHCRYCQNCCPHCVTVDASFLEMIALLSSLVYCFLFSDVSHSCPLEEQYQYLSHNKPRFRCNIPITNFLVSNTCKIRLHDIIGQSTVPMYSSTKYSKTWLTYMAKLVCFGPLFFNIICLIQLREKKNLTFVDCWDKII